MNLDERYKMFVNGQCNEDILREDVLSYAYKQVTRDKYIEAGDFILEFIPKVNNILTNYKPELASFKHYINKHIKWLMYSFSKDYIQKKEKREAYQYHYIAEFKNMITLSEENTQYKITQNAKDLLSIKDGCILKESCRKRLEIFTLKNSRNLTPEQISILVPLLKRTQEWFYNIKEDLDSKCIDRIANRDYLQQRYNRLFIEITRDQGKLLNMDNGEEKEILYNKMREKQKRKNSINEKLKSRNCGPKNEEIAKLLGIPKGTVDSSLFYMKKTLLTLLPELIID